MVIEQARFDSRTGRLTLGFRFDEEEPIEETIVFPGAPFEMREGEHEGSAVLGNLQRMLGVIASTSYYKARLPARVRIAGGFDEHGTRLVREVFREGLHEFAYRNGLDAVEPEFEFEPATFAAGSAPGSAAGSAQGEGSGRWLVAVGGGKDSVVAMEMLKQAGEPAVAACVGSYPAVRECVSIAGLELIEIERRLALQLAEWNGMGAPNGHVPVTAIHSLILLIAATLRGDRGVVMANERSADEPTRVDDDGRTVNHQYSKSFAFETGLRAWLAEEVGGGAQGSGQVDQVPDYFSILRPLSELEVCRRFAAMTGYHSAFVSCNVAYRRDPERRTSRWCCECPKCRCVYLGLAPFLRPEDLLEIFGRDLLGDAAQGEGFADLLRKDAKPFECVGTRAEVRAAFGLVRGDPRWRESPVVRAVCEEFGITAYRIEHAAGILAPTGEHSIPERLARVIGSGGR